VPIHRISSLAAKSQPESQKLLGRTHATSHDRDFSQEVLDGGSRRPDGMKRPKLAGLAGGRFSHGANEPVRKSDPGALREP